jgi:hypothetical protein
MAQHGDQWMLRYMFDLALGRVQPLEPRTPAELETLFAHRSVALARVASYYREAVAIARA